MRVRPPPASCIYAVPSGRTRTGAVEPSGSVIKPFASSAQVASGSLYSMPQPTVAPPGAGAGAVSGVETGAGSGAVAGIGAAAGSTLASPAYWAAVRSSLVS